jgi:hypothetical protein
MPQPNDPSAAEKRDDKRLQADYKLRQRVAKQDREEDVRQEDVEQAGIVREKRIIELLEKLNANIETLLSSRPNA